MDSSNYPRSPRKLQKRSLSTSPYPRHPRHSVENASLSFSETRTLSDETDTSDTLKGRISSSSLSERQVLGQTTTTGLELGVGRSQQPRPRSHLSPLWWLTEILVLCSGLVYLLAICIILWRADGKPPPRWPLNTNLNTIVAFLASLAKVTFVMAIVEGLGQLKWIWFLSSSRPRRLIDFQVFEEASKGGGWGSWKLLFRRRGWLASLGALILVSGLMTATFTQMAITYPVVQAEAAPGTNETATVQRATSFSVYDGDRLIPGPFEAVREQQAVYQGGFYAPDRAAPHLAPVCSSGDCVWPTYGSLAVCSDVVNLTAQNNEALLDNLRNVTSKRLQILYTSIKSNGDIYNWTNFQAQALTGFYPVILAPMFSPSNKFNASVQNLILNDNFVAYPTHMLDSSSPLDMSAFHFMGLTFWWCTKSYSTQVKAGKHTTTEVSTRSEVKPPSHEEDNTSTLNMAWSQSFYPCYSAGTCNTTFGPASISLLPPADLPHGESEVYPINVWTGLTVSGLLAATMWDSVLMDPSHGVVTSNGGGIAKALALAVLGDFMAPTPAPQDQLGSARQVVGNIARMITNLVRQQSDHFTPPSIATNLGVSAATKTDPIVVTGTAYTPQAFVRVHWSWMSYLSIQLAATGLFLGLTMAATARRGMQVLKSSSLATLCALQPDARAELGGMVSLDRLKEKAGGTLVRLERDGDGMVVGLGTVAWGDGKDVVDEEEGGVEEVVDTRRYGRVFEGYDFGYLARTDSVRDGVDALRRIMTDD